MGRLIIDGNSVFEIDEKCLTHRKLPKNCDIEKYIQKDKNNQKNKKNIIKY